MAKIFIPNYSSSNCAYIQSSDVLRVYDSVPVRGQTITYKDYYIHSDYMYNTGSTSFGQYSTLPECISSENITTDVYYRVDFPYILITFFLLAYICFWIPWKILLRIFRRWN